MMPDLDQTFSSVLQAQADLIQSAAQLGVVHSYEETPNQRSTGWPMRKSPSCVSLKFASTQTSVSDRIAMRPWPT